MISGRLQELLETRAIMQVLAWMQLLLALTAGFGAYVFFRKVLRVSFWPAAIAAWCYPLTATYIVWQGFALPAVGGRSVQSIRTSVVLPAPLGPESRTPLPAGCSDRRPGRLPHRP